MDMNEMFAKHTYIHIHIYIHTYIFMNMNEMFT